MAQKEGQTGTLPDGRKVIFLDGAPRLLNSAGLAEMGGGYFKNVNGQTWREGPHGGFSMIAGPTTAEVDKHSGKVGQINASMRGVDAIDKKLRETKQIGPMGWFTDPNDISELQGLNANLLGRLKEQPYNLGVLAGPDMGLMEAVIGKPDSLKDATFRKAYSAKLRNVARDLGNGYRDEAKTLESTGGRRAALPNLFRAEDSTYTPEEWGSDGVVPKLKTPTNPFAGPTTAGGDKRIRYDAQGNRIP